MTILIWGLGSIHRYCHRCGSAYRKVTYNDPPDVKDGEENQE